MKNENEITFGQLIKYCLSYIKAEREQFNVQDELVRQLKGRMQLSFSYKQIASVKFKITG